MFVMNMQKQNKLFEIEPLKQPQQIGFVWYDKMNLVEKKRFLNGIKIENFFNDFLYKKFNDFEHFITEAKRQNK